MSYVSKDQYRQACAVDLAAWLLSHHPEAVRHKYGAVTLLTDEHVSVKDGFHGFLDFRTGDKGNNIDFLTKYLGYDYPGAVIALLDLSNTDVRSAAPPSVPDFSFHLRNSGQSKSIDIPESAKQYRNLFAYLMARGIPADVVQMLIDRGILYQSEQGSNAVFINPQRDYLELRGTNAYADKRCKERADCPDYEPSEHQWCRHMDTCSRYRKDTFHGCRKTRPDRFWYLQAGEGPADAVYICEAAIDAVSLYVLHQKHGKTFPAVYVSIGGVANQQAIDRIKRNHGGVVIATDNDKAGDDCRVRNPDLETIRPANKDWNEDLQKGSYYGG